MELGRVEASWCNPPSLLSLGVCERRRLWEGQVLPSRCSRLQVSEVQRHRCGRWRDRLLQAAGLPCAHVQLYSVVCARFLLQASHGSRSNKSSSFISLLRQDTCRRKAAFIVSGVLCRDSPLVLYKAPSLLLVQWFCNVMAGWSAEAEGGCLGTEIPLSTSCCVLTHTVHIQRVRRQTCLSTDFM